MQDYMKSTIDKSYNNKEDYRYYINSEEDVVQYFIQMTEYPNVMRMYIPVINEGNFATNRTIVNALTEVLYSPDVFLRLMTTYNPYRKKLSLYDYLRDHPAWAQKRIQIKTFECPEKCKFPFEDSKPGEVVLFGDRQISYRCHWENEVSVSGYINLGDPKSYYNVDKFDDLFLKLKKFKK